VRGTLRIATRGSPLARLQAERVGKILAAHTAREFELVVVRTLGDVESSKPLSLLGGQGVFVKEVQQAVLDGSADLAVHSAKDLPSTTVEGLVIGCVPERADPRDAMVGCGLEDLATGATVATGSPRRRAQLASLRPDLTFCELRGNIATRVERAEAVGAGVMALAALERLGLRDRVAAVLEPFEMLPQVGQGALAVECRADDTEMLELLSVADDLFAHRHVDAERSWLSSIGGGCNAPVAAFAQAAQTVRTAQTLQPEQGKVDKVGEVGGPAPISLEAMIATYDGRVVLRRSAEGSDPSELGRRLARELLDEGGGSSLDEWANRDPDSANGDPDAGEERAADPHRGRAGGR
jgi:hydroxymethylbilane synthase